MEIEAKFVILSPRKLEQLTQVGRLLNHPLSKGETTQTVDIYFDTKSFQLLRHGFALRLRRSEGWSASLKSLGNEEQSLFVRFLRYESLPEDFAYDPSQPLAIHQLPTAIQHIVSLAIGPRTKLQPLCQLVQRRTKRLLLSPDKATSLAEVSIDQITVYRGEDSKAHESLAQFCELEVELMATSQDWLQTFCGELVKDRFLRINHRTKFERALQRVLAPPEISSATPVSEFCRATWLEQFLQILSLEDAVRYHDVEAVHDMRVAIRRMRAAGKLFGDQFRPRKLQPFQKQLRHTARLLGAVRDHDVAIERLQLSLDCEKPGSALQKLIETWQAERAVAHATLLEWLNAKAYDAFIVDFLRFCQKSGAGAKPLPRQGEPPIPPFQLRHRLPLLLQERYAHVRAFESVILEAEGVSLETWHALRIECKYLRYSLEFAESFLGADGSQLIAHLKTLQSLLGDLNDAAVSEQRIAGLQERDESLLQYQKQQREKMETQKAAARKAFVDFISPAQRQRMQRALSRL